MVENINGVPVFMYHALDCPEYPAGAKDTGEQRYVLQLDRFSEHMEYLHREKYKTFLLEEFYKLNKCPVKSAIITFDDGHKSNFLLALPLLRKYGFKAEFFITTDWIGMDRYMSPYMIRALHDAGMGIGSHGVTHNYFCDMSEREIETELQVSKEILSKITGRDIISFSAPGGRLLPSVVSTAKRLGYQIICSSKPGMLSNDKKGLCVPRLGLQRNTNLEVFKLLIHGNKRYIKSLVRRYTLLLMAKNMLNNNKYEWIRNKMLKYK